MGCVIVFVVGYEMCDLCELCGIVGSYEDVDYVVCFVCLISCRWSCLLWSLGFCVVVLL